MPNSLENLKRDITPLKMVSHSHSYGLLAETGSQRAGFSSEKCAPMEGMFEY